MRFCELILSVMSIYAGDGIQRVEKIYYIKGRR